MRITLACIGKLKEKYLADAVADYTGRVSKFCTFEIIETDDLPIRAGASRAEEAALKTRECASLLARVRPSSFIIALDPAGETWDSEGLARKLEGMMTGGISDMTFVIGGSLGLSDELLKAAGARLSLSKMTFPHQLARLIITEQIYRAFKIMRGETYHK